MARLRFACAIIALALAGSIPSAAQDKGVWSPTSNTASSITGGLVIADAKLTVNFVSFPLAKIRPLTPAELGAVFDADANSGPVGNLYRLSIPAARRFLHHNTLCGSEDTQWMATYIQGKTLQVAFFSGSDEPKLTFEWLQNSTNVCGTFTYAR
ncbi:MAG TPA: hypothetical protein VKB38_05285 [Terracidiphilus sp.]|nr:hypothetical protein [Terracidiphilus sp.]